MQYEATPETFNYTEDSDGTGTADGTARTDDILPSCPPKLERAGQIQALHMLLLYS